MQDVARIVGLVVAGLALVTVLAVGGVFYVSDNQLNQRIVVQPENIVVPTDISAIQRGQHLASAVALCTECHGANLSGKVFIDDPSIGRIVAPNLTRAKSGIGATFSTADFVRAIRHGVDPSGRQLLLMPSDDYNHFSDADLGAIIAYVKSVAAIDNSLPQSEIRSLGRVLFAVGQLPLQPADNIDRELPRLPSPPPGVSVEYGAYLALNAGCPNCHGPGLSGGKIPLARPGTVAASNITPGGVGGWAEADFVRAMRTGTRPDGGRLDTFMPWPYYAQMTDDELRAIWRFLQSVPPRPTGSR
jgi:mono/diheme cytochrome c family protein